MEKVTPVALRPDHLPAALALSEALRWQYGLEGVGLSITDAVTAMVLGGPPPTGKRATLYALSSQSLGCEG